MKAPDAWDLAAGARHGHLSVLRYDPESQAAPHWETAEIEYLEGDTVLQALISFQEEVDGALAFDYGCRYKKCGMCAMEIDGKPRLACRTRFRDGMRIAPLRHLRVVRDLVVDRQPFLDWLRLEELFIPEDTVAAEAIIEPEARKRLSSCTECLACLAACPDYNHDRQDLGGPYHFLRLAMLHLDPRDHRDRTSQARSRGIARCSSCRRCYCTIGLQVYQDAIAPLLGEVAP